MPPTHPSLSQGIAEKRRRDGDGDGYHHHRQRLMGRRGNDDVPGLWDRRRGPCYHPAVAATAATRNWGHLQPCHLRTSLLLEQKVLLAMSRAQVLADLRASAPVPVPAAGGGVASPASPGGGGTSDNNTWDFRTSRVFSTPATFSREDGGGGGGIGGGRRLLRRTITTSIFPHEGITGGLGGGQPEADGDDDGGRRNLHVNRLLVGVCIFRLDRETLRPAVLLVQRPPMWWARRDQHVFTTTTTTTTQRQRQRQRQTVIGGGGGERWELPGGKVADADFCISAAIDRLVGRMLGLKVTKVMVMLPSIAWRAEVKVLLWDRGGGDDGSEGDEGDGASPFTDWTDCDDYGGDGHGGNGDTADGSDERQTLVASPTSLNGDVGWRSSPTNFSGSVYSNDEETIEETRDASLSPPPTSPPDPPPASEPPPPPPPRHPERANEHRGDGEGFRNHTLNSNSSNNDEDTLAYPYDWGPDYDPSLEPAPLSVRSRTISPAMQGTATIITGITSSEERREIGGEEDVMLFGTRSRSRSLSLTASSATLAPYDDGTSSGVGVRGERRRRRRDAQMIPYKIVRRAYMQLNFGVLVDEDNISNTRTKKNKGSHYNNDSRLSAAGSCSGSGGGESPPLVAGFPLPSGYDSGGGVREREKGGEDDVVAFEWATCVRVREINMSEDLRRVVLEGLDWMAELTGRSF